MPPETNRYAEFTRGLTDAVLGPTRGAATEPSLRQAVEARAASFGSRPGPRTEVPQALTTLVDRIAQHAYRVTDDDVVAVRQAGYSEQAIFEITASAALGAGLARLERGLAALRGTG
jgi:alkylhydroperoxidase family enzyme